MEDNTLFIESLLERTADYGKTSYQLVKLKVIDTTSDRVSTFFSHFFIFIILSSFVLFLNLGLAFWLGELLGQIFYGFLAVAAFYALVAFILHFFTRKMIKRFFYDYIIRQLLN
ncbi:MAG: hypothetical protein ACOYMD_01350 [Paludibacter sp.]